MSIFCLTELTFCFKLHTVVRIPHIACSGFSADFSKHSKMKYNGP